jgi:hypothetical protein
MAQMHTIIRRTIHQHEVNQAVKQGHPREQVQTGSITFVQRFGSSLNLNLHLEKLAALVPPPRVHQVRYAGCLATHSKWRGTITPPPRQQGIPSGAVIRRILSHLKLAAAPPPLAPARLEQGRFAWACA